MFATPFLLRTQQIWNLANAGAPKGKFDKDKFFTACKLVATTQHTGAVSEASCCAASATPPQPLDATLNVASVGRTQCCACCSVHTCDCAVTLRAGGLRGVESRADAAQQHGRQQHERRGGCHSRLSFAPSCSPMQVPSLDGLSVTAPLPNEFLVEMLLRPKPLVSSRNNPVVCGLYPQLPSGSQN